MSASRDQSGAHDVDFLHGSWRIVNERLTSRLADSDDWERFGAEAVCRPVLAGLGKVFEFRATGPGWDGFEGASLRLFDPATGLWSIYWADNVACRLFPPLIGRFTDGLGQFFGDDYHEGRPVRVRFRWSNTATDAPRYEQAFSADGGATWETNWVMTFARV